MSNNSIQTIVVHALANKLDASLNAIYALRYFSIRDKMVPIDEETTKYRGSAMQIASSARPVAAEYTRVLFNEFKSNGKLNMSMSHLNKLREKFSTVEANYHSFMTTPLPPDEPSRILIYQFKSELNLVTESIDEMSTYLNNLSSTNRILFGINP